MAPIAAILMTFQKFRKGRTKKERDTLPSPPSIFSTKLYGGKNWPDNHARMAPFGLPHYLSI